MASFLATAFTLTLAQLALSAPSHPSRPCVNFRLSIPVKADNAIYNVSRADSAIETGELLWDLGRWTAPTAQDRIISPLTVEQTFGISAQLCVPEISTRSNILQIATHGGGFAKSYWDVRLHPERYSYVDAALNAGYSILTYDRLGVGDSDHPDAYKIVQAAVHVEILKEIATLARNGDLTDSIHGAAVPTFDKIILVGHSIGTLFTLATIAKYGDLADGAVGTALIPGTTVSGITQGDFGWEHAKTNDPKRFRDRGEGFLIQGTQASAQHIFFKKGYFEPELLAYAGRIKDTSTVGELLSSFSILNTPGEQYSAPLLFALAEYDMATCGGDCKGAFDPNVVANLFPHATDLKIHIQPGSGHGMTMHSNATGHYQEIFNYLQGNGL